jgi:hypothetical protein
VHWLLFVAMLLSTATVFLELALPRNVLAGVAKAAAVLLQGAWLVQIASIEFEGELGGWLERVHCSAAVHQHISTSRLCHASASR